jgi:hypothetical protein
MWTFSLLSLIAALQFRNAAKQRGYDSRRFWLFPLIAGHGLWLFSFASKWVFTRSVGATDSPWQKIHGPLVDIIALVLLFTLLAKAWKQIKQLPPRD